MFWIIGRPGNGKTQTLRQLLQELPTLEGAGKYAFAFLRFDLDVQAAIGSGLARFIVQRTLGGGIVQEVRQVSDELLGRGMDASIADSVALGIDVLSGLAQLPPVSLFATAGLSQVVGWIRARRWYVTRRLREKWSKNPELLELLTVWVQYTLRPTTESWEVFDNVLRRLAATGGLFHLFTFMLEQAGYSTLVLVFDEVNRNALLATKPFWDPPETGLNSHLNLVIVLAAQEDVWQFASNDEVLERRFCRTDGGCYMLPGPRIEASDKEDDVTYVLSTIDRLLDRAPHLRRITAGDWRRHLDDLCARLRAEGAVTWQRL